MCKISFGFGRHGVHEWQSYRPLKEKGIASAVDHGRLQKSVQGSVQEEEVKFDKCLLT